MPTGNVGGSHGGIGRSPFCHVTHRGPHGSRCSPMLPAGGDPLDPLLFCLSIYHHYSFLSAELCVMYLDDITMGGSIAEIGHDLEGKESLAEVGLCLSTEKSGIICNNLVTREAINMMLPGAWLVDPSSSCLLGSPLGNVDCISGALREKFSSLQVIGERL